MEQLKSMLMEKTGLDDAMADKVISFLQEHMADIPGMLGGQGGGLMDQAKGMLGGLLGGDNK